MQTVFATSAVAHSLSKIATIGRLLFLAILIWSINDGPAHPWIWVAAIVVADVLDGVLARYLRCDTLGRRALDATVDRVSIHTAFGVAITLHPQFVTLYIALAARDCLATAGSGLLLMRYEALLTGGRWHKLASLSSAGFGLTVLGGSTTAVVTTGMIAVVINWALFVDYLGGLLIWRVVYDHAPGRHTIRHLCGLRVVVGTLLAHRGLPAPLSHDREAAVVATAIL